MNLKEYFEKKSLSQVSFAKKIGISKAHICNILKGKRTPSLALMRRIIEITKGEVTVGDLFNPKAPSRLKTKKEEEFEKI